MYIFVTHAIMSCGNKHHKEKYSSRSGWRMMCWDQGVYFQYTDLIRPLQGGHISSDVFAFFSDLSRRWWSDSLPLILHHPSCHILQVSPFRDWSTFPCLLSLWTAPSWLSNIFSLIISRSFHERHSPITKNLCVGVSHILLVDFSIMHMPWKLLFEE